MEHARPTHHLRLATFGAWARRRRWLLTAALAVACALVVQSRLTEADHARRAWGTERRVAVAVHDLLPGMLVTSDDVTVARRPVAVLTDDAIEDPTGRVVVESIAAGEAVVDRRLAGAGRRMPGALADGPVFSVAVDRTIPKIAVGDHVDLWAPTSARNGTQRAARRARVIAVDDRSVSVSVSPAEADTVARAVLDGTLVVALSAVGD